MSDKKVSEMSVEEKALLLERVKTDMRDQLLKLGKMKEEVQANLEKKKKKIEEDTEFSPSIVLEYWGLWMLEENVKNLERAIEFAARACVAENYNDYTENARGIISAIGSTPMVIQDEDEIAHDREIFHKGFNAGADELHRRLIKKK